MKRAVLLGLSSLVLAGCATKTPGGANAPKATATQTVSQTVTPSPSAMEVPKKKTVVLKATNGQSGTAVIEDVEGKVKITISLTGEKVAEAQPAHIHIGVCPGVGAVKYPLSNVVNGKSTTMLTISMADLISAGPLAINVHKSAAEVNVYTACGGL